MSSHNTQAREQSSVWERVGLLGLLVDDVIFLRLCKLVIFNFFLPKVMFDHKGRRRSAPAKAYIGSGSLSFDAGQTDTKAFAINTKDIYIASDRSRRRPKVDYI